jgi:xanthine dehydrogenase YagS FAD-binding subunit
MNRFGWSRAGTISEAAAAATVTAADAMMATRDSTNGGEKSVVKAGGIDLLDLLKEDLLAPTKVVSLRDVTGLTVIAEEAGGLRSDRW